MLRVSVKTPTKFDIVNFVLEVTFVRFRTSGTVRMILICGYVARIKDMPEKAYIESYRQDKRYIGKDNGVNP